MSTKEKKEKTKTKTSLALQPHKPKKKKMIWPSSVQWCVRWHFKYWRLLFCASIAQVKSVREVKMLTRRYSIDRMISFHASETERRAQVASTKSRRIYKSNLSKLEINRKKNEIVIGGGGDEIIPKRQNQIEISEKNWTRMKKKNELRASAERAITEHRCQRIIYFDFIWPFALAFYFVSYGSHEFCMSSGRATIERRLLALRERNK